jgi:hypothetical protein
MRSTLNEFHSRFPLTWNYGADADADADAEAEAIDKQEQAELICKAAAVVHCV